MSLERITAIAKSRVETGAYGGTAFRMSSATMHRLKALVAPPVAMFGGPTLGGLLDIPIFNDESLPAGKWELITDIGAGLANGAAIESGVIEESPALAAAHAAGIREGRQVASDAILAHADQHAPKGGNMAQRSLRRHLHIAARVALPAIAVEEAAEALSTALASPAASANPPIDLMGALRASFERAKADRRRASLAPDTEETSNAE